MHVAVVGGSLSGVATAYLLNKEGFSVDLFSHGTMKIPVGLCHPFTGREAKIIRDGYQAIEKAKEFITVSERALGRKVTLQNGIERRGWHAAGDFKDLLSLNNQSYLIKSGMTVYLSEYLEGMRRASKGVTFINQKIRSIDELESNYDRVILCVGAGLKYLINDFDQRYHLVKGQVLICHPPKGLTIDRSIIAKGHISPLRDGRVQIGSTYEHTYLTKDPDIDVCVRLLAPKVESYLPSLDQFKIDQVLAGFRVSDRKSRFPSIRRITEKTYAMTGFRSRGILYHGFFAYKMKEEICES